MILQLSTFAFRWAYQNSGENPQCTLSIFLVHTNIYILKTWTLNQCKEEIRSHANVIMHVPSVFWIHTMFFFRFSSTSVRVVKVSVSWRLSNWPAQNSWNLHVHTLNYTYIHQSTHINTRVLDCNVSLYILHFITISYIKLRFTTYYSIFHHIRTYYITLNYIILHYITTLHYYIALRHCITTLYCYNTLYTALYHHIILHCTFLPCVI